jgi:hypothetical protein
MMVHKPQTLKEFDEDGCYKDQYRRVRVAFKGYYLPNVNVLFTFASVPENDLQYAAPRFERHGTERRILIT